MGSPTLEGSHIRLRPLAADDAAALAAAVDEPEAFRWTTVPSGVGSAADYIATAIDDPRRIGFAVIDRSDGSIVGTTSYYDIEPQCNAAAIGYTWYSKRVQGTAVNPEAKLLLLQHAFDACGAVRIVWHTDERNAQSRAAILKLGTTYEGLLAKHRPLPDGSWRTTAQYAMVDDDWPANRARLQARIT